MTVDRLKILLADYVILLTEVREENERLMVTNNQLKSELQKKEGEDKK